VVGALRDSRIAQWVERYEVVGGLSGWSTMG